ncbi:MAG: RDD family protein [Anaerolineae bacterium]|nr:RDD family protein [Anaerolineae bacterium]
MMNAKMKHEDIGELAGLGERFVARLIDGLILGCLTGILFGLFRGPGGGAGLLIGFVYEWYFLTQRDGQTPGKLVMGLRVVRTNAAPLNTVDAGIRYLGYYIGSAFFSLGLLWALFDDKRRCWHDFFAGTLVVRA